MHGFGGYMLSRQHPWSFVRGGVGSVRWLPRDLIGSCEGRERCGVCVRVLKEQMCAMVAVCVCVWSVWSVSYLRATYS